jgi:acetyltransferase-like isoleucine patch superfamily enzyme
MIRLIKSTSLDLLRSFDKLLTIFCFYFSKEAMPNYLRRWQIAQVGQNTWITPNVRFDMFKNTEAKKLGRPLIHIGDNCIITEYSHFITHDTSKPYFQKLLGVAGHKKWGEIVLKDNCFIGIGCLIMPRVTIGPNSLVGAGSVVTKDVEPNSVYAGNPAKKIMSMAEYVKKHHDDNK